MTPIQTALFAGLTILGGSTLGSCRSGHGHHGDQRHGGDAKAEEDEQDEQDEDDEKGADEENGKNEEGTKEEVITYSAAPEAVRSAFSKLGSAESVKKVERITEDEVTSYEINYVSASGESSVTLSDRGDVMELEGPAGELPDAVKRSIAAEMKGAKIVQAGRVQLSYFEVVVERNGKKHEVKIYANGMIEEVD